MNFQYDKYYRKMGLLLNHAKTEEEKNAIKATNFENLKQLLNKVEIDFNKLKCNFINLLLEDESARFLWILYSKYENGENYIDKISSILKRENQVIRGGVNTYKMNGWMAHSLYVYQIVNQNIANALEIINFNGRQENKKQVQELHDIYIQLSIEAKFLLKIFTLIHDIGVIEDIAFHDKLGSKYVEQVLSEIGINQMSLERAKVKINFTDVVKILQEMIENHVLITSLSSESSDLYVENKYKKLMEELPNHCVKKEISALLFLLAYGDVIAVDESLMDKEKYERIKDCYHFFEQIRKGQKNKRDETKVAIERICDIIGEHKILTVEFNTILEKNNIEKKQFIENMYNIKLMKYTGPLMKSLKDSEMTIRILYELFELIEYFEGKEALKEYTIIFVPDKHENDFVEQFKNNNFFNCVKMMKENNENECTYQKINISKNADSDGKYLLVKVV